MQIINFRCIAAIIFTVILMGAWCMMYPKSSDDDPNEPLCELTIDKSGYHKLNSDIGSNLCAVKIKADGVILDLNGHLLYSGAIANSLSYGVYSKNRNNIEIKNGSIHGFSYGVLLSDKRGLGIDLVGLKVNTLKISGSLYRGIQVQGVGSVVSWNNIENVGGAKHKIDAYAMGIEVSGGDCHVHHNSISEVYASEKSVKAVPEAVAISVSVNGNNCIINNNDIKNSRVVKNKSTFGIWVDVYSFAQLNDNRISGMHYSGVIPPQTRIGLNYIDKPFINVILDRS